KFGEVVEVVVTIKNKALVDAESVWVTLWRGDPDNCLDYKCLYTDSLIGRRQVGLVPAQDSVQISPGFRFKYDGTNNIFATIDDYNSVAELKEDNNKAYNMLFLNIREGYLLQDLRLDPVMSAEPVTQHGYVAGYYLKATVLSDTFTRRNVLVQ